LPPIRLSGRVVLKGKPLARGYVTLVDQDTRRFSASIQPDGSYLFRNAALVPGRYRVMVEENPGDENPQGIPRVYQAAEMTPLVIEVEKGPSTGDLNLN
jgi:hypothetical protein